MAIDTYTGYARQPIRQIYEPINFGILNTLGQQAERQKAGAQDELDALNAKLKVNTIPGSQDQKNVQLAQQQLRELTNKASADNLYDPVVARGYIKQARELVSNPRFEGYENEYGKWAAGMKRKQEASNKENAASSAFQYDFDKSTQDYITGGGFDAGKSVQGHDFEFGVNKLKAIQEIYQPLKASGSEASQRLKDLDEIYSKVGYEGVSLDRVIEAGGTAFDAFKGSTAEKQLRAEYKERVRNGQQVPSSEDDYVAGALLGVGKTFVWGKTTSNEADIKNQAIDKRIAKLAKMTTGPVLKTSATGKSIPWDDFNSFDKYSNEVIPGKIASLQTLLEEVKGGGIIQSDEIERLKDFGVDPTTVRDLQKLSGVKLKEGLDKELAATDSEFRNVNKEFFAIASMPGGYNKENFDKYKEDNFRGSEQTLPRGKAGSDVIVDKNGISRQTAAWELENKGLLTRASDFTIQDENGEILDKEANKSVLKEGKLSIKSLYFGKDAVPVLKVGVMVKGGHGEPTTEKLYDISDVSVDLLKKIANDHKTMADNSRYTAQVAGGDQGMRDLEEARDQEEAATKILHGGVSSYVNRVTSGLPSNTTSPTDVTFDLGAIGVPGKKVVAKKVGDSYIIPGYNRAMTADGLIKWFSDIADSQQPQ